MTSAVIEPCSVSTATTEGPAPIGELPEKTAVRPDTEIGSVKSTRSHSPTAEPYRPLTQRVAGSPSKAAEGVYAGLSRSVAVASEAEVDAVTDATPSQCRTVGAAARSATTSMTRRVERPAVCRRLRPDPGRAR